MDESMHNNDVDELLADPEESRSSPMKAQMLRKFRDTLLSHELYKRVGQCLCPAVTAGDTLTYDGYFLTRATLQRLIDAMQEQEGYVLVNFGLGNSASQAQELQLVLTVVEEIGPVSDLAIGSLCLTTAQIGNPTTPPLNGVPHG